MDIDNHKSLNNPLVSICIPVFNGANYINESINSVLMQDYPNFELVIIDNCSTDSTPELISSFHDDRIRYIKNSKNIGALNNFSKCIQEAKGEYFVLLPHDDLLLPGLLSEYVKRLDDKSIGIVYSSVLVVDAEGNLLQTKIIHEENRKFNDKEALVDLFENFMPIQLAMVRTDILRKVGGFSSEYGLFTDIQLWLKVLLDGWGCFFISKPYSSHRSHEDQGQNAFLNLKLDILSDHWGKKLDKEFWKKNSYNIFLLKLLSFVVSKLVNKKFNSTILKNLMLNIFIRSHMRFLALSIIRLNKFVLWQEILLFKSATKCFGLMSLLYYYPLIFLTTVRNKIILNIKISVRKFKEKKI